LVSTDALGELYYYDSVRISLGLFQHDVNVLWDLAVHDIAIMDHVLSMKPKAVSAIGISHVMGKPESIAYLTMLFDKNLIAHIHANWLAPVKVRQTLVSGSRKMVVYDELDPTEKIKVYDKGVNVITDPKKIYKMQIDYRMGDMWAPHLDMAEALHTEALHFLDCIKIGKRPITDGEAGLRVVRILEAADRSMKEEGKPIRLSDAKT
jgi:predicted dehydrogenase